MSNSQRAIPNRDRGIRVVIVDDQKAIRAKIEAILSTQTGLKIVGMAEDGDSAIAKIKVLRPDIVLMDIEMPKMNGIEVTKIISQQFPQTRILVLSTHEKPEYIQKIIGAGADGYLLKQTPAVDFVAAVYAVHKGYSHFGPSILKKVQLANVDRDQKNTTDVSDLADRPQSLPSKALQSNLKTFAPVKNPQPNLAKVEAKESLPPIDRWLTWGRIIVMVAIALILPLSFILNYKTKVKVPASVRSLGEVRLVQAKTEGQIADVLLKVGDKVNRGDAIATIDPAELENQQAQIVAAISQDKLQLSQLNSQIAAVNSQTLAETERNNAAIEAAQTELASLRRLYAEKTADVDSQFAESTAQLAAAAATLEAAKNRLKRYQSAAAEGAVSQEQLAETKLEVRQQEQEIKAAQARLATARASSNPTLVEIEIVQQRVQQSKKLEQVGIATLNREREALIQQRLELEKQLQQDLASLKQIEIELEQTSLKATAAGIISQLELRNPGQTVQPGQEIAQIIPSDGILELKALVSLQDIGKLKPNQKVQMRVSACPYSDYGILQGKISRIAPDARQPGEGTTSSNNSWESQAATAAFYDVAIAPETLSFGRKQYICNLQPGMKASAEIVTREETVLKFLLRKAGLVSSV